MTGSWRRSSERRGDPSVELTASALQATFPARQDAPLAVTLLRLLSLGRPVTTSALAEAAGREVGAQLARWPNVQRDDSDAIDGFGGLTLRETAHRFEIDGRPLHTWCAWDTLFLPAILDVTAHVRSTCPVTGRPVELVVTRERVDRCAPDDVHVSFPPLEQTDSSRITDSFCCHVHFLAGTDAVRAWRATHRGSVLDLTAAFELGRDTVAALVTAEQR
jgi:alkylmercury lyase